MDLRRRHAQADATVTPPAAAAKIFAEHGFVVFRGGLPRDSIAHFRAECDYLSGLFLRSALGKADGPECVVDMLCDVPVRTATLQGGVGTHLAHRRRPRRSPPTTPPVCMGRRTNDSVPRAHKHATDAWIR